MAYTVAEVSKRLNISPHTIRYYAKEGLLDFVERDANGVRIFHEKDFQALFMISILKRAGMSIKQIREFLKLCEEGDATIPQRLKMIIEQRENLEEKITELQDAFDVIKYKCWIYEVAKEAGTLEIHKNISEEEIPPKMQKVRERIKLLTNDLEKNIFLKDYKIFLREEIFLFHLKFFTLRQNFLFKHKKNKPEGSKKFFIQKVPNARQTLLQAFFYNYSHTT